MMSLSNRLMVSPEVYQVPNVICLSWTPCALTSESMQLDHTLMREKSPSIGCCVNPLLSYTQTHTHKRFHCDLLTSKMTSGYITIHLYGNIWIPYSFFFFFCALVGLTDTSAFTEEAKQSYFYRWTIIQELHGESVRMQSRCHCRLVISLVFRNSFSQHLHLKMTFWHHLHGNHFASSSAIVACVQTGPLRGLDY